MAITRAQQARQLYQAGGGADAGKDDFKSPSSSPFSTGYSGAKSAVETGRVSRNVDNNDGPDLQKVADAVGTVSDLNRAKNVLTGGGIKAMLPDPASMAAMFIINKIIENQNKDNQSLLTQDDEEVPMMADGGIMGGLADGQMDEMGRQMYGLGKLVKKAKKTVRKVLKSPIGKAALLYTGLGGLGSIAGGGTFFGNFMSPMSQLRGIGSIFSRTGLQNIGSKIGLGSFKDIGPVEKGYRIFQKNALGKALTSPGGIITATSLLPLLGLGTGDETEEEAKQLIADNTGLNFDELRPQGPLRFAADGGLMRLGYQEGGDAEPVAKKTMPLIDMDGKEKDYRETGGFVDMGRMERADDVPARLSKNEFVFTADAVRNAGDGDIDKGAEVMYNMMKNLEAGGDVSEESQGMDGARRMFQTSQRLEEVL